MFLLFWPLSFEIHNGRYSSLSIINLRWSPNLCIIFASKSSYCLITSTILSASLTDSLGIRMGRKTKRTCGWWRDDGVSARNISELNGYRRRDGGKTKRFKSLHAFILD